MFDYDNKRWRKTSFLIRQRHDWLCQYCDDVHTADVVDHVCEINDVSHLPNYLSQYAYNADNLIPCCHKAHNIKTQYIKRLRQQNADVIRMQNDPIVFYDNLPELIDLTDIDIVKDLVFKKIRD